MEQQMGLLVFSQLRSVAKQQEVRERVFLIRTQDDALTQVLRDASWKFFAYAEAAK